MVILELLKYFGCMTLLPFLTDKRDWIIQQTVVEMLMWVKSFGVDTLSMEELKFLQQNKNASFNRMASNFSYSNITKTLISACFKENIALV